MRIAIVGTGIAGHGAALAISQASGHHEIVVYERDARAGGHSATVDVDYDGVKIPVDTGFIVYNEKNYPNLTAMFAYLGVATQASDMSFSVSADRGRFEWCGRDGAGVIGGLFAQKSNLLSVPFLRMLLEIRRFQERALSDSRNGTVGEGSLGDYLARNGFSDRLRDDYLVPMGAAIWSTSPRKMLEFPATSFIDFFDNHCLLQWDRPQWRTVTGGSRSYVEKLGSLLGASLRIGVGVRSIVRDADGVDVHDDRGGCERFDHVVLAAHAPESLALLSDASVGERNILSACGYSANDVWLHRDVSLMPKRRAAWASWNFLREGHDGDRRVAVSYWMNRLQSIDESKPLFVTLNPPFEPRPELTFGRFSYDHPQFDGPALAARQRLDEIQGVRRTWFCGAWTRHGFHEDGLASGLRVAARLGCAAPWAASISRTDLPLETFSSHDALSSGVQDGGRRSLQPSAAGRKAVEEVIAP
ncbi:MAG: FAD-dependent oxidoreductase [Beijerinckiaceae bacterium]|nr:FAD-dependent oxidoreductase [Beijerinckiaceae bacterium]